MPERVTASSRSEKSCMDAPGLPSFAHRRRWGKEIAAMYPDFDRAHARWSLMEFAGRLLYQQSALEVP